MDRYKFDYDIVFLEIEPHLNGMDVARNLRKMDDDLMLVFVAELKNA